MAPKLTKRELERERATMEQQNPPAEQPTTMDAYGMPQMPPQADQSQSMMMGGDGALGGGAPMMMHPSGSIPSPAQQGINVYQYGEQDLNLVGDGSDMSFYDSRRPVSPAVTDPMLKRRADEAFVEAPSTISTTTTEADWESTSQSTKKKKPQSKSVPTPTSAGGQSLLGQDKSNKGLRHFSMKVCKKVEEKGRTNYNEVADELVREVLNPKVDPQTGVQEPAFDEKNIRRRVYDALNVLMAMDIISKEKKEIRWKGLPSNAQHDIELLQREKKTLEDSVAKKREHLQELILQRIGFKRLIKRNLEREGVEKDASAESEEPRVPLPFIIVNTNSQTIIQCEMTEDRSDVFFNFSSPFNITDDTDILKRMEMQKATASEMQELVPPELLRYVPPDAYLDASSSTSSSMPMGAPPPLGVPPMGNGSKNGFPQQQQQHLVMMQQQQPGGGLYAAPAASMQPPPQVPAGGAEGGGGGKGSLASALRT